MHSGQIHTYNIKIIRLLNTATFPRLKSRGFATGNKARTEGDAEMQAGCVPGTMGTLSDVPGTTGAPSEEDTAIICSRIAYGLVRVADMTYAIPAIQVVLGK